MYTLTGSAWLPLSTPDTTSQKQPVLSKAKSDNTYNSSQNEPIPVINSNVKVAEYMDSNVETLLKEQIFLMKFILLFLGFMLLSNILTKKN